MVPMTGRPRENGPDRNRIFAANLKMRIKTLEESSDTVVEEKWK